MKPIEELYMLYKEDIYRYLISLTHNPTLSEDLLSDTFVNAISSIKNFKEKSSVKTWLFSIARNMWLQCIRKEKPAASYDDFLEIYVSGNIIDSLITKEIVDIIKNLLLEKNETTQSVINMRIDGISYCEIAKKLKISESSARVIDFRTKKWLIAILEKEGLI